MNERLLVKHALEFREQQLTVLNIRVVLPSLRASVLLVPIALEALVENPLQILEGEALVDFPLDDDLLLALSLLMLCILQHLIVQQHLVELSLLLKVGQLQVHRVGSLVLHLLLQLLAQIGEVAGVVGDG